MKRFIKVQFLTAKKNSSSFCFRLAETLFFIMLPIVCATSAFSSNRSAGNDAYVEKDYPKAKQAYEKLLQEGPNATVFYNLGNTYYRLNDIPNAILYYQKSLKYDPSQKWARSNLELCQSKIADRFDRPNEMFFFSYIRALIQSESYVFWGGLGILSLFLLLVSLGFFVFAKSLLVRKICLGGMCVFLAFLIVSNIFAYLQKRSFEDVKRYVVFSESRVYESPSVASKPLLVVHAGTTVEMQQASPGGWVQVLFPDGTTGWTMLKGLKEI